MAETVITEFSYFVVAWDDSIPAILTYWMGGFVRTERVRQGLEEALQQFKQKSAKKWLADSKNLGVLGADTQKWISEEWSPRLMETEITHMAFVVPTDALAMMSMKFVNDRAEGTKIKMAYFDSRDQARTWLQQAE